MRIQKLIFLMLGLFGLHLTHAQIASELIYMDQGRLTYVPFAMTGQSNAVNTVPDFSYAGYMGGGVSLPSNIPVEAIVNPEAGDDSPRIQEAIDLVSALEPDENGFRGAVLIKAGFFSLETPLRIIKSGVVLLGEGQGMNGTVLHSNRRIQHDVISIVGPGNISINTQSEQQISTSYVPVGSYSFDVLDASAFDEGDAIVVTKTPNQTWIDELGMDQEALCLGKNGCEGWTSSGYIIDNERIITGISGNTISINIPLVDVIEDYYGGGTIAKIESSNRINNIGIENMRIQSFYDGDTDEDHGWVAIKLENAENCWIKGVTGQYFGFSTVNIENSNFNTIEDCAYIDPKSQVTGSRRYSFAIQSGLGNLFQRCYTRSGRHDFVTGSKVTGPNVFVDGLAEDPRNDIGPHHRWATGTLFDNLRGGSTRVWNRGNSGTGHGWSGAQTMFWNIESYSGEFRVDSPIGSMNWGIGCVGSDQAGEGYWESWGTNVDPRSLYLQQLQDRLGEEAVDEIAIPEQKTGNIYEMLSNWGGYGDFENGGPIGLSPSVSFMNPVDTLKVGTWDGSDIELVTSDPDGNVENVKLLINGELIAVDNQAPFLFSGLSSILEELPNVGHYLQAIATDNDGNVGSARLLVIEVKELVLSNEILDPVSIKFFPNPTTSEQIIIETGQEGFFSVRVVTLDGKLIDEYHFFGATYQFQVPNQNGMYIMEIRSSDHVLARMKLFVE